jgi:uncharacterized protein
VGAATAIDIKIGNDKIEDSDVLAFTVERDMGQPDMAAIVVSNQEALWSTRIKVADEIVIKAGDDMKAIYKGEVVGLEANYRGGEKARLTIRGMNKMHRLLRKRKSITFVDKTDEEIIKAVAHDAELKLVYKHDKSIAYKHVYQHNQTDLEFLRMRAGRIGCHVWCFGDKLFVKQPDLDNHAAAKLKISESGESAVKSFTPRLSAANIVKKVTVQGWNPETKELLKGEYSAKGSKLGDENAVKGSGRLGKEETFTVDHPIWTVDEAKALAKARLVDISLGFITGELEVIGDPKYDLADIVRITASAEKRSDDDPFNGRYYVMGVSHRYSASKTKDGGYTTILRLARDAQKDG